MKNLSDRTVLAEDEGFEPSVGHPTHAFQACALGRYANPPVFLAAKSIGDCSEVAKAVSERSNSLVFRL